MSRALPMLVAIIASSAAAEPVPLDGQALTSMMSGASIRLDTPLGTTVPVHYGDNGQVWGEAGSVAFALGAPADRGRWWVDNHRLCHRWTVWFDRETQCLRLRLDGTRLFWVRDDGKTGTATLVSRPQAPPAQVNQQVQTASLTPSGPPQLPTSARAAPVAKAPSPIKPVAAPLTGPAPSAPAKTGPVPLAPAKAKSPPRAKDDLAALAKPATAATATAAAPVRPNPGKLPATATAPAQSASALPPPASPPTVTTYKVAFVDDDDVLNVRTGPSTDYASIGAIPPSAQGVKIMGVCEDDWCPIVHRGISGWVNRYYLVAEPAQSAQTFLQSRAPRDR